MRRSKEYWSEQVAAARRSGKSLSSYAREHEVSRTSLYQWCSKLKREGLATPRDSAVAQSRFMAVRVAEPAPVKQLMGSAPSIGSSLSHCRLVLAPGVGLEMSELPDPHWLVALQRAAQGVR